MTTGRWTVWASWGAALAWTGLVGLLMLLPGDDTVAEDTSRFFGGTDWTDAAGHVILFGVLTVLWWAAWRTVTRPRPAVVRGVTMAFVLAITLETVQLGIPHRGATLFDLLANLIGVLAGVGGLWLPRRRASGGTGAPVR